MSLLQSKFGNSLVMRKIMSLSKLSSPFLTLQSVCDFLNKQYKAQFFLSANIRKLQLKSVVAILTAGQNKFTAQFNKRNQSKERKKLLLNASLFSFMKGKNVCFLLVSSIWNLEFKCFF